MIRNAHIKIGDRIRMYKTPLGTYLPNPVFIDQCQMADVPAIVVNISGGCIHYTFRGRPGSFTLWSIVEVIDPYEFEAPDIPFPVKNAD